MTLQDSFIPRSIFDNLKDPLPEKREQAMKDLQLFVESSDFIKIKDASELSFIIPYFSSTSVKIAVSSFLVLRDILGKLELNECYLDEEVRDVLIPVLVEKWNDGKLVIRHATSSVMAKIASRVLGSDALIDILIGYMPSVSRIVKEELINFIIYCLLKYAHSAYNYEAIINALMESLSDSKLRIKFVSAEALAVIHSKIGNRIQTHLEKFRHNDPKAYKLLQDRFKQPTLPMLSHTTKGVVEHKLLLKLHRQNPQGISRRVQSANIAQKTGSPSSPTSPPSNGARTVVSQGTTPDVKSSHPASQTPQIRYPSKVGKSALPEPSSDESARSKFRAHSAPRRLQSDNEYVTFDPNGDDSYEDSREKLKPEDDSEVSEDEGYVALEKPILNVQQQRGYRYRNSVVDTDEKPIITPSVITSPPRQTDMQSPVSRRMLPTSTSDDLHDSKINLWLIHKEEDAAAETEKPGGSDSSSHVKPHLSLGQREIAQEPPIRKRGQSTPRSKRILRLNIEEDEQREESIFPKVNHSIELGEPFSLPSSSKYTSNQSHLTGDAINSNSQAGSPNIKTLISRSRLWSRENEPSIFSPTTQLKSRRTLNLVSESHHETELLPEQPTALTNAEQPKRKRPRPIRVVPTISVQPDTPKESKELTGAPPVSPGGQMLMSPSKSNAAVDCLEREDLLPLSNPSLLFKKALDSLNNLDDWEARFNAVTDVRRVCVHHTDLILTVGGHELLATMSKLALDLRSLVSKNAMICIQDMYEHLGKQLDNDLQKVIPLLFKKSCDSNKFIYQQAATTLKAIVKFGSTEKCLLIIVPLANHKNDVTRTAVADIILESVRELGTRLFRFKEMGSLLTTIVKFIEDRNVSVRATGRAIAYNIAQHFRSVQKTGGFEKYVAKYLTTMDLGKFIDAVEMYEKRGGSNPATPTSTSNPLKPRSFRGKLSTPSDSPVRTGQRDVLGTSSDDSPSLSTHNDVLDPFSPSPLTTPTGLRRNRRLPPGGPTLDSGNSSAPSDARLSEEDDSLKKTVHVVRTLRPRKPVVSKRLVDDRTGEELKQVYTTLNGTDWKQKLTALTKLSTLISSSPQMFGEVETMQIMDSLILRLVDANVKVCAKSFHTLTEIIPIVAPHLNQFLYRIIQHTGSAMGANQSSVQDEALRTFRALTSHVDSVSLISHIPQLMISSNGRVKGLLLQQYTPIIASAYAQRPEAVTRYVVPSAFKLYQETSALARAHTMQLMRALYNCLSDELFALAHASLSTEETDSLRDFLKNQPR